MVTFVNHSKCKSKLQAQHNGSVLRLCVPATRHVSVREAPLLAKAALTPHSAGMRGRAVLLWAWAAARGAGLVQHVRGSGTPLVRAARQHQAHAEAHR